MFFQLYLTIHSVRRNDELALLYEKIKLQQATMKKGELQYTSRLEDVRVLKLEIKKLQREKSILSKSVSSVQELRKEIFHTQRYLNKFRMFLQPIILFCAIYYTGVQRVA